MIKIDSLLNIIVICLITVVFGCLLGLAITRIVDYRLSDISINLPKINIPYLPEGYDGQFSLYEGPHRYKPSDRDLFESFSNKSHQLGGKTETKSQIPEKENGSQLGEKLVNKSQVPELGEKTENKSHVPELGDKKKDDNQNENTDKEDKEHVDNGSTPNVDHMGATYYKDPKNMTPQQIQKFKEKAKIYKMTLQDYINWLTMFIDDPDALPPKHLSNLLKLRGGQSLTKDDIPRDQIPYPLTAQQYFEKVSTIDDQLLPQNLDTAGVQIPANYMEYSQFDSPRNLKHLDDYNHIEKLKKYEHKESIDQVTPKISHEWNN